MVHISVCIFDYSTNGVAVSDFKISFMLSKYIDFINNKINKYKNPVVIKFSTSNIFYALREKIIKGDIDYKLIVFRFKGKDFTINEYGIIDWPEGFCDVELNLAKNISDAIKARFLVDNFIM